PAAADGTPAPGAAGERAAAAPRHAPASEVELTARTDLSGWLDRLLLAAGGAHWLRRSLELTLRNLASTLGDPAPVEHR
ncbi:hypothetical protein VSS74_15060, partial [Conexibacter stalactiti]